MQQNIGESRISGRSVSFRAGYTLAELGIVIALVAIVLGLVVEIRQIRLGAGRKITSIQLSSDGNRVAAGFTDGSAAEWDTKTGTLLGSVAAAEYYDSQYPVVVCADGRMVARILLDGPMTGGFASLQISSLETGHEMMRRPIVAVAPDGMAFSKDGSRLALAGMDEVFVFDPRSTTADDIAIVQRRESSPPLWKQWRAMAFDPSGHDLYHLSQSAHFIKWNLDQASTIQRQASQTLVAYGVVPKMPTTAKYHPRPQKPEGGNYELRTMVFSADGKQLATASVDTYSPEPQWIVELLDADAFETINTASATSSLTAIEFIDSGKGLAVLFDDQLEFWDAATLKVQQVVIKPGSEGFVFPLRNLSSASDAGMLAVADEQRIQLFDGKRWRTIVDVSPSHLRVFMLAATLPVVIASWIWLRYRGRRTRPVAGVGARCRMTA